MLQETLSPSEKIQRVEEALHLEGDPPSDRELALEAYYQGAAGANRFMESGVIYTEVGSQIMNRSVCVNSGVWRSTITDSLSIDDPDSKPSVKIRGVCTVDGSDVEVHIRMTNSANMAMKIRIDESSVGGKIVSEGAAETNGAFSNKLAMSMLESLDTAKVDAERTKSLENSLRGQ